MLHSGRLLELWWLQEVPKDSSVVVGHKQLTIYGTYTLVSNELLS